MSALLQLPTARLQMWQCTFTFSLILSLVFITGLQYGICNEYDGQCRCPEGWSGNDCLTPQCGSLADGDKRRPRPPGEECECDEGWGGINCNGMSHLC